MLYLKRNWIRPDGAFGTLAWNGLPFAVTLERTYPGERPNTQMVKLPEGFYKCTRSWFHKGGYETFLITSELIKPERRILIHRGNNEEESEGCILIGENFHNTNGKASIAQSGVAFGELMQLVGKASSFDLFIANYAK